MTHTNKTLIVIDLQNDYFPDGQFPLWNTDTVLNNIKQVMTKANELNIPIVHVQHVADSSKGKAPFFNEGTTGVAIHNEIMALAPDAPVVVKHFADGFLQTNLEQILQEMGSEELFICGMMTQNCVTHTAMSDDAKKYQVNVLSDCCTTVNEMIHLIALNAMAPKINLLPSAEALA
ncbi:cysteine hydrolase family protein [Oceanospirillum beijerinckii]|uniref:cysteine hydrolase family protein n=1 Tax=Oceanospirillum beijerinckii TaxID=64976 RepID=UPI00041E898F|nr:cysteine hydrolase family protein [Oceanospirillum beijerinckii]MAC48479.1 cysteine hydrolase [Oceanospirillum sp.]